LAVEGAPARTPNDGKLLAAVRAASRGDELAFETVAKLHGTVVYRFLVLRLGNAQDARDALQETLVAAWLALPKLRDPHKFRPWIGRIAARKAAAIEAERQRARASALPARTADPPDTTTGLFVVEMLNGLPPILRNTLLLRYVLDLSERETACALRVPVGTVKSRTARALRRLSAEISGDTTGTDNRWGRDANASE